jgi:hypothetical protein
LGYWEFGENKIKWGDGEVGSWGEIPTFLFSLPISFSPYRPNVFLSPHPANSSLVYIVRSFLKRDFGNGMVT